MSDNEQMAEPPLPTEPSAPTPPEPAQAVEAPTPPVPDQKLVDTAYRSLNPDQLRALERRTERRG
jgi:hypothetical protein